MRHLDAAEYHLGIVTCLPLGYVSHPGLESSIRREQEQKIAHQINLKFTKKEDAEFATVLRTECYVFNPDIFWEIVTTEALKLSQRVLLVPKGDTA